MKIPPNNQWTQNAQSDVLGSLGKHFNLDLSTNKGATRISPRTLITTDDITNLGVACGFVRFNAGTNGYYCVAGDRVFNTASVDPSVAFADSSSGLTGGSDDTSDIIFFSKANTLAVSANTFVEYFTSVWASVGTPTLTTGTVHMMCEYASRLYVTDNYKKIVSYNTSMSGTATGNPNTFLLGTLSADNIGIRLVDIIAASDGIWILTATSQYGEPAKIYKWDGATQDDPDDEFVLDTSGVMCGAVKDDTLYIINSEAELMVHNGGTFVRVPNGKLPVNPSKYLKNTFSSTNNRWIHPRGITVTDDGKFNILINNVYEDDTIEEKLPSGIWEFDPNNTDLGWVHKKSLSLYVNSVIDYGQVRVSRVGALKYVKTPNKAGTLLAGARLYTDASSTKEVILTDNTADTLVKYGSVATTKIFSPSIEDTFHKVIPRFKKFLDSGDTLTVKYRFDDPVATEATITWTSTTTFTTTTNVSAMLGYEVWVIQGKGSGKCAHITSIVNNAGTYTVTVDSVFTGATSGTAKALFQNWIKSGEYNARTVKWSPFNIGNNDSWVELKLCLQCTGTGEINDMILINSKSQ